MREQENERARVRVSGRVQGVFFRDSTRERAEDLGLSGYVKNTADGAVGALFEGPSGNVREIVRWCEHGPSHAAVENVSVDYETAEGDLTGFEVR